MRDEKLTPADWFYSPLIPHPSSLICNLAAFALIHYTTPHLPFRNEAEVRQFRRGGPPTFGSKRSAGFGPGFKSRFFPVKKRISTALATLLLLALSQPALVIAQQTGSRPPVVTAPGGRSATPPAGSAAPGSRAPRRPRVEATEAVESDVSEALTVIQDNYVDGNKLNYNDVFKSSIIGMLRTLDPHSNYYDAKEFEEQRADWRSEYYGIGATIGDRRVGKELETYVLAALDSTPAVRAGLRCCDRILAIDGESVKGKASGDVRDRLRGPRNTVVKVTVERASDAQQQTVEITRDAVPQPTVPDAYFIKPGVGYVDMTRGFNYTTADEFISALEFLRSHGMTGLVVDLRGNGGGILDQAVRVAEQFLGNGT